MTEDLEIRVKLGIDDSEVDPALAKVAAKAGTKIPSPKLDVDTSPAWGKLDQIDTMGKRVQTTFAKKSTLVVEPKGDKDTEKAFNRIRTLAQHMDQVKIRPEIQSMEISDTAKKVMELNRQWDDLNAKPDVTLGAKVVGGGLIAPKTTGLDLKDLARGFRTGSRYSPMYAGAGLLEGASLGGMLGIGAGIGGAGIVAGGVVAKKLVTSSEDERKLTQFTAKTMGGTASVDAAKRLSEETGFLASDFMNAAIAGKGLKDEYGMQTEQVAKLVKVSADLAAESPYKDLQTVTDSMAEMKSALGGDAKAAERLGMTLSDNYMKTTAFGGVLKSTWDTLNEATQYQYRYKEMLLQTQAVLGASKDETDISTQTRKLNKELGDLKTAVGDELVGPMTQFVALVRQLVDALPDWLPKAVTFAAKAAVKTTQVAAVGLPGGALAMQVLPPLDFAPSLRRGGMVGERRAAPYGGFGAGAGSAIGAESLDVTININNNNNSQIDASASAPAPH